MDSYCVVFYYSIDSKVLAKMSCLLLVFILFFFFTSNIQDLKILLDGTKDNFTS